jgi:anti-sigma factor RsiW
MSIFARNNELACQEVVELVTDYLEGTLSRSGRRRFEAHIATCEHCTEYLEQMRATIRHRPPAGRGPDARDARRVHDDLPALALRRRLTRPTLAGAGRRALRYRLGPCGKDRTDSDCRAPIP